MVLIALVCCDKPNPASDIPDPNPLVGKWQIIEQAGDLSCDTLYMTLENSGNAYLSKKINGAETTMAYFHYDTCRSIMRLYAERKMADSVTFEVIENELSYFEIHGDSLIFADNAGIYEGTATSLVGRWVMLIKKSRVGNTFSYDSVTLSFQPDNKMVYSGFSHLFQMHLDDTLSYTDQGTYWEEVSKYWGTRRHTYEIANNRLYEHYLTNWAKVYTRVQF